MHSPIGSFFIYYYAMSFNYGITALRFNIMENKNPYGTLKAFVSVFSETHYSSSVRGERVVF